MNKFLERKPIPVYAYFVEAVWGFLFVLPYATTQIPGVKWASLPYWVWLAEVYSGVAGSAIAHMLYFWLVCFLLKFLFNQLPLAAYCHHPLCQSMDTKGPRRSCLSMLWFLDTGFLKLDFFKLPLKITLNSLTVLCFDSFNTAVPFYLLCIFVLKQLSQ